MTQGAISTPTVSDEHIEYGHVFANYVKSVADTPADPDPYPDIVTVNGQVSVTATFPGSAARGSLRLPGNPRSYGLIVTGDTFEIINSKLVDHEGREGVWLVAAVDEVPLSWQAVVTLQDSAGRTIYNKSYIIHYDLWHETEYGLEIDLPDLIPTPGRLEPPEGAAVELAKRTIEQIEALTATNQQIKLDVEGLKSEVVALHGQTGQRLTAAEAARDAAVVAQGLAEAAQSASEAAQSQAQTARAGAQTARTGAESARDAAAGSASDAADSAAAAAGSASDADESKVQAQFARSSAETAASAAADHRQVAESASVTAQNARGQAQNAAHVASGHASDAAASAAESADERVVAQDAAALAEGHAAAADGHRVDAEAAAALAQSLRWVVKGAWSPGSYEAGDVVVYDERAYYAQTATSVEPPAQPWVPLTPASAGASHWDDLDGKPTAFPPEAHTHDAEDVSGPATPLLDVTEASVGAQSVGEALDATTDASRLEGALTDQVDASGAVVNYVHPDEGVPDSMTVEALAESTASALGSAIALYGMIQEKSDVGHTHDGADITGALTDQANVGEAMFAPPGDAMENMTILEFVQAMFLEFGNYSRTNHKHPVGDLTTTGTASSSTYLRGDGTWATPPNNVYSVPSQAEAEAGTATTGRAFSAQRVRQAIDAHPRVAAAPATWHWAGTSLPTSASQVHAQARVGDFIVAPNLTTDPGWHRITGV